MKTNPSKFSTQSIARLAVMFALLASVPGFMSAGDAQAAENTIFVNVNAVGANDGTS
jgi:hypothetical protein